MTEKSTCLVIGLTGGIGSGKSTVADAFAKQGVPIVDADAVSHALTQAQGAAMPALIDTFGPSIADARGALDRAAMRKLAFNDAPARVKLEGILHPLIRELSLQQIEQHAKQGNPYVLNVVPLLIEGGHYKQRYHRILVVDCEEETQIARVMKRSQLSRDEVLQIMAKQATRAQRLAAADDVIHNTSLMPEALNAQVAALHAHYLALSRSV
jgi:dephospho-CoA kinase